MALSVLAVVICGGTDASADKGQTDQLQRVWGNLGELAPADRLALLRSAAACKLEDLDATISPSAIYGCLRAGAAAVDAKANEPIAARVESLIRRAP